METNNINCFVLTFGTGTDESYSFQYVYGMKVMSSFFHIRKLNKYVIDGGSMKICNMCGK